MTTAEERDSSDILDLIGDSVVRRDSQGRALSWNAAAERLYGWRRDDVIGRLIDEVLKTRSARNVPIQLPIGIGDPVKITRTTAAGAEIAVEICLSRRANGLAGEVIEVSRGVDGWRSRPVNSEERYRNLFQFVPVPVVRIDRTELAETFKVLRADGVTNLLDYQATHPGLLSFALNSMKIVEVNQRAVDLFGASDAQQVFGSVVRLWSESPEVCLKSMQRRYEGGASFEAQIKFRTFNDDVLDVLYVTDFPEAATDEARGLACLVDISERIKAQETLQHLQAEFARAARVSMLGELTASIVHEINQPLTAIATSSEAALLWLDRPQPEFGEARTLMSRVVDDAQRAATIVAKVRSMSTRHTTAEEPLVIADIIEEAISFLRHEIQRHSVRVVLDLTPGLPHLNADRVQLQQVVVNLVLNAVQAMATQPTEAQRLLAVRTLLASPRFVGVEIEDNGPGISAEHLTSLFERFFTTKANGMGIGLSISRSIVEAHGGSLQAGNKPNGSGARFWFTLPTAAAQAALPISKSP